jgi:hypothetical protein
MTILVLVVALLVACGGNEDNTTELDGTPGDEGFGDVDATLSVTDTTGLEASPVAPELTVTEAVTQEVEATEMPAETPTVAATNTPEAEATTEMTATAEVTGTADMTGTADITGTMTMTGTFLVRASTLLSMELSDEVDETAGLLRDILISEDGTLHYAILDLDGEAGTETVALPWDQLNLQTVSGVETDNPEYGLTWADDATAAMTTTLEAGVLDDDSGVVDATALGLEGETATLLRLSASVDEDLLDDELADDNLDDILGANGEEIGDIEDLLVDADAGRVIYALVEVEDDILQVDDRLVAIPWERLALDAEEDGFTTDVDLSMLEGSPVLDLNAAFADSAIRLDDAVRNELDTYWELDGDS